MWTCSRFFAREILCRTLSDNWNFVKCGHFKGLVKVVLGKVLLLARYPAELVCQHLDDVCGAGAAGMDGLLHFGKVYRGGWTAEVRSDLL